MVADTRYRNHQELVRSVILFLHENFKGRWWENATGAVKTENGHFQRYGLVGSTDIIGFTDQGRFVGIEIKTGSGVLSKVQKNFKQMALDNNCIHIVIHDEFNINSFKGMRKK